VPENKSQIGGTHCVSRRLRGGVSAYFPGDSPIGTDGVAASYESGTPALADHDDLIEEISTWQVVSPGSDCDTGQLHRP